MKSRGDIPNNDFFNKVALDESGMPDFTGEFGVYEWIADDGEEYVRSVKCNITPTEAPIDISTISVPIKIGTPIKMNYDETLAHIMLLGSKHPIHILLEEFGGKKFDRKKLKDNCKTVVTEQAAEASKRQIKCEAQVVLATKRTRRLPFRAPKAAPGWAHLTMAAPDAGLDAGAGLQDLDADGTTE